MACDSTFTTLVMFHGVFGLHLGIIENVRVLVHVQYLFVFLCHLELIISYPNSNLIPPLNLILSNKYNKLLKIGLKYFLNKKAQKSESKFSDTFIIATSKDLFSSILKNLLKVNGKVMDD